MTICTYGQECILGAVVDGRVRLSVLDEVARPVWYGIAARFERIELDALVAMANHVHGIVVVRAPDDVVGTDGLGAAEVGVIPRRSGETTHELPLQKQGGRNDA